AQSKVGSSRSLKRRCPRVHFVTKNTPSGTRTRSIGSLSSTGRATYAVIACRPPKHQPDPRNSKRRCTMDLVAYWQLHCAPYLRARFGRDERGASLVEYALLVALIAVVCLVAIAFLGRSASTRFSNVGSAVNAT